MGSYDKTALIAPWNEPPILCECMQITEADVQEAMMNHRPNTLKELIQCSGAGKGCNACHPILREVLAGLDVSCPSVR